MKVHIFNEQKVLKIPKLLIKKICAQVAETEGETFEEVSLHFVSKEKISEIHDEYFQDPSPTDCISFPLDGPEEEYRVLGDVFVCPEVAMDYVEKHGGDPLDETCLYVVHGLLHLFGYDDMTTLEKKRMRARERKNMQIIRTWQV